MEKKCNLLASSQNRTFLHPPPQGFPTIKVFGADKRNPTDYKGERSATEIVKGGMAAARDLVKSRQGGGAKKKPKDSSSSKGPSPS